MNDSPRESQPVEQPGGVEPASASTVSSPALCWVAVIGLGGALLLCVLNVPQLFHNMGGSQVKQMVLWGRLVGAAGGLAAAGAGIVGLVQTAGHRRRWLANILVKHGQLQRPPVGARQEVGENALTLRFTCDFVAGKAEVTILVGLADGAPRIDDIEVAGVSPRD